MFRLCVTANISVIIFGIVSAPRIFSMCWSFVSQFMVEDTRKKFTFLGCK